MEDNTAASIQKLKAKGKKVICYFSAGSSEEGRPDNSLLLPYTGTTLDGWPGEKWLDIRNQGVQDVMKARIARAAEKGCDAVDPDNMDGYENPSGLGLMEQDSIDYIKFLSAEATEKGMSIGLKNAGAIISAALPYVHFSVNEQCNEYEECHTFAAFIKANKPVFNIEYIDGDAGPSVTCSSEKGFSSLIKKMDLDGWVKFCNGTIVTTATLSD